MPFPFVCPHCGLETLVDDEYAGQAGPCAGCGKEITVAQRLGVPLTSDISGSQRAKPGTITLIVVLSIMAASVVFAVLMMLVFPSFRVAQELWHKTSCRANLQRIAQAIKQYEIEHGTLPPAFIPDAAGKPMHSWRVLILPQLGYQGLHARYNFNEPWNGPNNSKLVSSMPDVFGCPSDPDAAVKYETSYMVLVGPKTLFPGAQSMRTSDLLDQHQTTILVAEIPVAGVVWMEPKDLNATRMQYSINLQTAGEMGSYHPLGVHVVMFDGTVRFFEENFPTDYLQGMSTRAGDEEIPWEVLDE
jgi:hypothetical protein